MLPHGITACAATYDAKTLAFGLANGSVFIWDDAFGGHTKVLPRLGGAATALAFVHGLPHKLLCAASDGSLFLHDLVKPEDSSQKPFSLPLPVSALHFLPNEPYCLCVCLGDDKRKWVTRGGAGAAGGDSLHAWVCTCKAEPK